jgi:catechol 2,3-dioxygenase-like lactoylglutathione lyase family enzyme
MNQQPAASPLGANVAVTHILVAAEPARSRDFWVNVLGAELYREYGGTSVVLRFAGTWLLLVSGGGPTADKPWPWTSATSPTSGTMSRRRPSTWPAGRPARNTFAVP